MTFLDWGRDWGIGTLSSKYSMKTLRIDFVLTRVARNSPDAKQTCGPRIPNRIGIWKCWF